jgi:pentatricopeptide repeat protein
MNDLSLYFIFGLGFLLFRYFSQSILKLIYYIILPRSRGRRPAREIERNVIGILKPGKEGKLDSLTPLQKFNLYIKENGLNPNMEPFEVLNRMQKMGISPDNTTYNSLLDATFTSKNFLKAHKFFKEMKDITSPVAPDVVTFNIYIKGLHLAINSGINHLIPQFTLS